MSWIDSEKFPPKKNGMDHSYLISDGKNISIGYYEPEFFQKDDPEWSKISGITYSSSVWYDDSDLIQNVKFYKKLPKLPKKG